ncbi:hypothetical protein D3C72_1648290 [compost metagenome]
MARSALSSSTVSVISSSSSSAGSRVSSRMRRTLSTKMLRWKCTAEMFTATTMPFMPRSSSSRQSRQAVASTHSLRGMICPVSSATGTNCAGEMKPSSGCCQRSKAS